MLYKFLLLLISLLIFISCSENDVSTTQLAPTSTPLPDIKQVPRVEPTVEVKEEPKYDDLKGGIPLKGTKTYEELQKKWAEEREEELLRAKQIELRAKLKERIKEIKITESKSIFDLENEYDTSNRLIELGWNKPTEKSPEFAMTNDLSLTALNSVVEGVSIGTEYLGNYGPLKVFIIGSDIDEAKIVAKEFCEWSRKDNIEYCINKDQGIDIVEMAIYKGNNGFAQHSRHLEPPNQSFVMGNPDKSAVKIAIHEYVHIYQNAHKVDGWWNDKEDDVGLPRWLEEGSAELLARYLVGDYADYLRESLNIAKYFKKANPNISIRNLENEEVLRILEKKDCIGGHCVGTLQYETGAVATALLINQTSMDYFYKEYIPKIAYLGGEKAFETSFNITINEFHEIFDSFLDLSVDEMMNFLYKYQK